MLAFTNTIRLAGRRAVAAVVCVAMLALGLAIRTAGPASAQVAGLECWFVADNGSPHTSNDLLTYYIDGVGESFIDGGASPTDGTGTTLIEGIAGDPVTGILYATDSGMFGTIDTVTGEFSAIGPTGYGDVDGLALDPFSREMYGVARLGGADELFKIDLATGALIPGGIDGLDSVPINSDTVLGLSDNDDIGINPYNGQMYAVANNGGPDRLILVDKDTGNVTDVGQITSATDIEGFSFDPFGSLLGSSGSQDNLYQMDLGTGAGTFIFDLDHLDYESIECSTKGYNVLSGTVFLDKDGNGVFDGTDAGTGGVTVTLYRDANGNGVADAGDPILHSIVTAADGSYLFDFGATGPFVVDIDEATLPLSATLTTDNVESADFGTTFGQTDAGNDFGYTVPASLPITKTSDAPADLAPGDTITYTIEVTNLGSTTQSGIIVNDLLPAGTTYVPESTTATHVGGADTSVFTDDFETDDFTGGTGPWASDWIELGEFDGPGSGDIQIRQDIGADPPQNQDFAARIRDNDNGGEGIRRDLDLSSYGSAELNFDYRTHELDNASDYITIDVSTNGGGTWTEIGRIAGPADSDLYRSATFDLSPFLSPTASIRFLTSPTMGGGDEVWIDNVDIAVGLPGSIVRTNAAADLDPLNDGIPPNLIVAADGVSIPATQTLTVTFQVVVVNPSAQTDVSNTASASSDSSPFVDDTVVDPLTLSSVGDTVWVDQDGDGVRDAGEPGLGGVTVNLRDGADAVLETTTTAGDGSYSFGGLGPADYVVEVIPPVGYGVTTPDVGGDDAIDSDVAVATGRTPLITVGRGVDRTDIDAGLFQPASIGDFVWEDLNANGVQEPGEPALAGVTVNLLDSGGGVLTFTTTDGAGAYNFTGLAPGTYLVEVVPPAGLDITRIDAGGDDSVDSDVDPVTGRSAPVVVASGDVDDTVDAGLFSRPSVGDRVWVDVDGDGIQDAGEPGFAGATVNLLENGNLVASTTTDASGIYGFTGLTPDDDYRIEVIAPAGYGFTLRDQGADDTVDSDVNVSNGRTAEFVLLSDDVKQDMDAGLYADASIGDFVWEDTNANGLQDTGEVGIGGVTVNLLDGAGNPLASTTTAADGSYAFAGLAPGDYIVEALLPAGFRYSRQDSGADDSVDSDVDEVTGRSAIVTLTSGQDDDSVDVGMFRPPSIGDFLWEDLNGNGVRDPAEPGIAGVTVNLLDGAGNPLATIVTDALGGYGFTDLVPATYIVEVIVPPGYNVSPLDVGGDDTVDSDIAIATGRSGVITLASGETNMTVDAGLYRYVELGDVVWEDLNGDGIQDPGEPGLAGVTVRLRQGGSTLDTTVTAGDGSYSFVDLDPGVYGIEVVEPAGYRFTGQDDGADDTVDSDVDPGDGRSVQSMLESGDSDMTVDAGLYQPVSIGDRIWDDLDGDGIQDAGEPGLVGVAVNLLDGVGNPVASMVTDGSGNYLFSGLDPGDYIVEVVEPAGYQPSPDEVGFDSTVDSNLDPVFARSDVLTLVSGDDNMTIDGGLYAPPSIGDFVWDDLDGDGIQDAGEPGIANVTVNLLDGLGNLLATTTTALGGGYSFGGLAPGDHIVEVVAPVGYSFSPRDQGGDDGVDSDVVVATGRTTVVTLISGEVDNTIDAGVFATADLGDLVWDDLNADGVQDAGEPGLAGVTVNLLDGLGNPVASTVTDGAGAYSFGSLTPGDYIVEVVAPVGSGFVAQDVGGDDTVDSDVDPATGRTAVVTLTSGETDDTVDAGLVAAASIGDLVWDDLNANGLQDGGEPGLAAVTVNLLDGLGSPVASTVTDGSGAYSFGGLAPGDYIVEVIAPVGFVFSTADVGADDAIDSDVVPATGRTAVVTLTSGETDVTVDAGLFAPPMIGDFVWDDLDGDGIQDAGEPGLAGVTVNLLDGLGSPVASTMTDAFGGYGFSALTPADYIIEVIAPAGYVFTGQDQGGDDTVDSDTVPATGRTAVVTISSGETETTLDSGLWTPAAIGDFVWDDLDGDGTQDGGEPGLAGVTVSLLDGLGNPLASTVTDGAGAYSFTGLVPGDYIVEVIAPAGYAPTVQDAGPLDSDDSDIDGAGRTPPIALRSGETEVDTDGGLVTGASLGDLVWDDLDGDGIQDGGEPGIANVTVNLLDGLGNLLASTTTALGGGYSFTGLAPGDYIVEVVPPVGYSFSPQDVGGDDTVDSDVAVATGRAAVVTLASGESNSTLDAGVFEPAVIGDLVWDDLDGDGVQDAGERGLVGVTVNLLDGAGNPVASTVTDGAGAYSFGGLAPGDYIVEVVPPAGYVASPVDAAGDDATDSDIDPLGFRTGRITLTSGADMDDVDAGLFEPAVVGDLVWDDLDADGIQDAGEPGLAGVTVNLLDGAGNPLAATVTDGSGAYGFTGLTPGDYIVEVIMPVGYVTSPPDQGGDDSADSDIDAGTGRTAAVTLRSGDVLADLDAGFFVPPPGGDITGVVFGDIDLDAMFDGVESGIQNLTVVLRDTGGGAVATTSTGPGGTYQFFGVPAGDYSIDVDQADPDMPAGYGLTTANEPQDVTVADDATSTADDIGYGTSASLAGAVVHDADHDGTLDPTDPRLSGQPIAATWAGPDGVAGTGDDVTFSTTTDGAGNWSIVGVPVGDYVIDHDGSAAPYGLDRPSFDPDATADYTTTIGLAAGENRTGLDFGVRGSATIGNQVFVDLNGNGEIDGTEVGAPDVDVTVTWAGPDGVLGGGDDVIYRTTTDALGFWLIGNLPAGEFTATVDPATVPDDLTGTPSFSVSVTVGSTVERSMPLVPLPVSSPPLALTGTTVLRTLFLAVLLLFLGGLLIGTSRRIRPEGV